MGLEDITKLVCKRVDQRQNEVFGLFFDKAKTVHIKMAHYSGCNCNYCSALREYIRLKICLHRKKKKLNYNIDFDLSLIYEIDELKREVSIAKNKKNFEKYG